MGSIGIVAMPGGELSLRALEDFDPRAPARLSGGRRRFMCPFPECGGKRPGPNHRSLAVDISTGAYLCHRCKARGKLREFREERPVWSTRHEHNDHRRYSTRPTLPPAPRPQPEPPDQTWRHVLRGVVPLGGTPAERYLGRRGIPPDLAHRSGARYSPGFYGRPAVVFPIRDQLGSLVAVSSRYLDGRDNPKCRVAGPKSHGVFATPDALLDSRDHPARRRAIVVTEAQIDALSLAACGCPAVALIGTSWPEWLPGFCAFRRVLLAFDADDAGDKAARELASELAAVGARAERLRPPGGAKDWNDVLLREGTDAVRAALRPVLERHRVADPHSLASVRTTGVQQEPSDSLDVPLPPELDPFSDAFRDEEADEEADEAGENPAEDLRT